MQLDRGRAQPEPTIFVSRKSDVDGNWIAMMLWRQIVESLRNVFIGSIGGKAK